MSVPPSQPDKGALKIIVGKFIDSKVAGVLANVPPFSWILRWITRLLLRNKSKNKVIPPNERTHNIGLDAALRGMVQDVVEVFGYAGAMVATYDPVDDALPVKAFFVDPELATLAEIEEFERRISKFTSKPVSLSDQKLARVYVHRDDDRNNLGVRAYRERQIIPSDSLFDLFTPIVPDSGKPIVDEIQQQLGIQQVITVPFFLETTVDGKPYKDFVGNLFAAKQGSISENDQLILSTLGQYVASIIQSENRRRLVEIIDDLILDIQKNLTSEEQVLQRIVQGIVRDLGYVGAMLAPYYAEEKVLPIKALAFDENDKFLSIEKIKEVEKQVSLLTSEPVSITDPKLARVYLDQPKYESNLSIIAAKSGRPEKREDIYDLFTPFAPPSSKGIIDEVQAKLGVHRVIAVPFFIVTMEGEGENRKENKELVGNLFALSRSYEITDWEIEVLQAFGQQAAAGLRNVRLYHKTEELLNTTGKLLQEKEDLLQEKEKLLQEKEEFLQENIRLYHKTEELLQETKELYRKSEDRRQAGEIFGKMAFSASASVHALRNHLGVIKGNLQLVTMLNQLDDETRGNVLNNQIPRTLERLKEMQQLIESLHEPWRPINDTIVDVNACIKRAVDKVFPGDDNPWITFLLSDQPLEIKTTPEMLTEAFKVLVKNAKEAMQSQDDDKKALFIQSRLQENGIIVVIKDSGTGIGAEYLEKIFEMRFTTKSSGLGFGLFWTKDYISGLGGNIDVTSSLGQGTSFTIILPVHARAADQDKGVDRI